MAQETPAQPDGTGDKTKCDRDQQKEKLVRHRASVGVCARHSGRAIRGATNLSDKLIASQEQIQETKGVTRGTKERMLQQDLVAPVSGPHRSEKQPTKR